jgi:hypothetical protein
MTKLSISRFFLPLVLSLSLLVGCLSSVTEREIQTAVSKTLTAIAIDQQNTTEAPRLVLESTPARPSDIASTDEVIASLVIEDGGTPTSEPLRARNTRTPPKDNQGVIKSASQIVPTLGATISSKELGENLIYNPWFRKPGDPTRSSLDGWSQKTDAGAWSTSLKAHNPSPDEHTGTSARWAFGQGMGGGPGVGGANASLYQVVASDPSHKLLQFQIWWIVLWIEEAKVTIYGGDSADGPWTEVWTPFVTTTPQGAKSAWAQTPLVETRLEKGYSYYKIELYGRYPQQETAGVKYTGVFFTTAP